jgi:rhamnose transport system substrate-binding protein
MHLRRNLIRKAVVVALVTVSLALLATTLLVGPSGAAQRKYTIAFLADPAMTKGTRAAAKTLGVRVLFPKCCAGGPDGAVKLIESLIASHVDAIVVEGYDPTAEPIFAKVRKAGILLISAGDDIAGKRDLWVSHSDNVAYGQALGDALASQMGRQGEYAILDEQGEYPIARTWKKIVAAYIPKAYPKMKLDAMLTETGAGDQNEVDSVKSFMAAHPNLKGLLAVTPTEAYMAGEAITQAGRIGQVFSAGNGGDSLADLQLRGYVRTGAADLVFAGNPVTEGYVTVWGARYLLTGHHFKAGAYEVGGPIGRVWYYPEHQELRASQPLTVTKANLALYVNTF